MANFGNFPIRIYKNHVQRTNKREVEKTLLQQESFRRTLILLLDGAFAGDEPKLSSDIQIMYAQCPLVFQKYLHTSASEELGSQENESQENESQENESQEDESQENETDHDGGIEPTKKYHDVRLWKLISSKEIEKRFQLSVRLHKLPVDDPLGAHVRHAYNIDYQEPYVTHLTTFATKWYQKASFFAR